MLLELLPEILRSGFTTLLDNTLLFPKYLINNK